MFENPDFIGGGIMYKEDRFLSDPELKEAFFCGMKKGLEIAEEKMYGERNNSGYSNSGSSNHGGYGQRGGMDYEEMRRLEDMYHERRRRRSNGQFY